MYQLKTQVIQRGGVTIAEFGMLRKLPPVAAELWLSANRPSLSTEELNDLLAAVGDAYESRHQAVVVGDSFPQRSLFVAAAWLAGASWGQLAQLFRVSRQTMARSVDRLLPPPRTNIGRRVTASQLEAMKGMFLELHQRSASQLATIPPYDLAQLLMTAPYDTVEGDVYGNNGAGVPIGMSHE